MVLTPTHARLRTQQGFSLMELAIVLMIVGTLMSGVLVAVGQSTESSRRALARTQLKEVQEALYGFAQTFGRLPCPATAVSGGAEAPVGGGNCTVSHGFVPVATLGLSGSTNINGLLLDPWQNPYRYSASAKTSGGNRAFTHITGLRNHYTNAATELNATNMLRVCDSSTCTGTVLSALVPAVVISMGANWPDIATASANEQANASGATLVNGGNSYPVTNTTDFVSTGYSETLFDDQLVWLSPHVLFSRMISAGKLP